MSERAAETRKCLRCGASVESCALCDEPECPAITCYRCMSVAFLDRQRPRATSAPEPATP